MAIAVTTKSAAGDTSNVNAYATGSFTPTANALIIVAFMAGRGSSLDPDIPSVTNSGVSLTWTQVADHVWLNTGVGHWRMTVFAAQAPASPSATTVTANYTNACTGVIHSVFEATGTDVANGVGQCVLNVVKTTVNATGASLALTLAAASNANNRAFLCAAHAAQETLAADTAGGWAVINQGAHTSPAAGGSMQWNGTAFDTSVSTSWATSTNYGGIAFELKAAGTGTVLTVTPETSAPLTLSTIGLTFTRKLAVTLPAASLLTLRNVGLVFTRKLVVTLQAAQSVLTLSNVNLTKGFRLVVTPAASPLLTLSPIGRKYLLAITPNLSFPVNRTNWQLRWSKLLVVTPFASPPLTLGAVNFVRSYKLVVTPAASPPLNFSTVNFNSAKRLVVTPAASPLLTFPAINFLRTYILHVTPKPAPPLTLSDIGFTRSYKLPVSVTNYQFATSPVTLVRFKGIVVNTTNYPIAFSSVGLIYTVPVPPEPEPIPELLKPAPGHFKPGDRVYISTQGDMWDVVSLKVYGMQRGSDHYLDHILEANPNLLDYSSLPGGLYILVPPIAVQTQIPLVPWKNATITPNQ